MSIGFDGGIPYRGLGRTGEKVSVLGLGGRHLGAFTSKAEAVRLVRTALDNGVNLLETSAAYRNGDSERIVGEALGGGYRERAFVTTQLAGRTGAQIRRHLEESLERLGVGEIDLVAFGDVSTLDDPRRIFEEGGAEELLRARDEGLVRFVGFAGNRDPRVHVRMLETADFAHFVFDVVQMPLNLLDVHYDSFERLVLPGLVERGTGVLGMKPLAAGRLPKIGVATPAECLHYAMGLPVAAVIAGCESISDLQQALEAARTFEPMADERTRALLDRTAPYGANGANEPYKTTAEFDTAVS